MKRKICFVLHSLFVGGAERRAATIANCLAVNGFEIEILLLDSPYVKFNVDPRVKIVYLSNDEDLPCTDDNSRVTVFYSAPKEVPLAQKIKLVFYKRFDHQKFLAYEQFLYLRKKYSDKIYSYLKKKKDCIIVSWMTFPSISTCYALKKLKNKLIIVECTSPEAEYPKGHPVNYIKEKVYSRAGKCICQTPDIAEYYSFLKSTKKYIIPNPIIGNYPERFAGSRKKIIVNFCRLEKDKNIPLLIDAFELLHSNYPEYELHIFGEGQEKDNLVNYASEKGLADSILFFDFDVNIHSRIVDYSMFVSSSNREGMSNSMLESMAIGLPTICTDCSGGAARMLIENYQNGILIPMNDVKAMHEAMKYLVDNPDKAEMISKQAVNIKDRLSLDRVGKLWINAICE